jgi:DNA polymerase III alpha subunit
MVVVSTDPKFIHEAKMSGATIQSVYQQKRLSDYRGWNGCVFGFYALKNLNSEYIFNIVAEREKNGAFKSIENFITRVPSGESIQTLIFIGAFRSTGKTKSINYRGSNAFDTS